VLPVPPVPPVLPAVSVGRIAPHCASRH